MSREKNVKYLAKNTAIFALSSLSTKFIVFLLVPLYTWKLSTTEYGIADLLFTITGFLYPLLTLNVIEAVFRFSIDKDKNESKIIHNAMLCNLLCIVLGLFAVPIIKSFTAYANLAWLFYFYLVSLSVAQTLLAFLKGREKLKLFAIGNVLNTVCVAVASIIFLVAFNMSVDGYFLAYIVANIITIVYCLAIGKIQIRISGKNFDKKYLAKMLKYSVVLLPTSFMWWIINSSDRIMVTNMVNPSANGIYAASYKIPTILSVAVSIFNQAWFFSAVKSEDKTERKKHTDLAFKHLLRVSAFATAIILLILKPFIRIYMAEDFYSAWQYVPILLVGFCFQTLATFIATTYSVEKNSKGMLFSGLCGAIMNIILNFALIPFLGVYGAAIATAISYVSVFLYRYFDTKKSLEVDIFNSENIKVYCFLFLCAGVVYANEPYSYLALVVLLTVFLIAIKNDVKKMLRYMEGFLRKWAKKN